jgi:hypothetical protein
MIANYLLEKTWGLVMRTVKVDLKIVVKGRRKLRET